MTNIVAGLVLIAFGLAFVLQARWGVDVANQNRLPGTKPATAGDRWWFVGFGGLFVAIGVFLILRWVFVLR